MDRRLAAEARTRRFGSGGTKSIEQSIDLDTQSLKVQSLVQSSNSPSDLVLLRGMHYLRRES